MKPVELYARVRHACHVEGLSQREAARRFGIDPKTVAKMLRHAMLRRARLVMVSRGIKKGAPFLTVGDVGSVALSGAP